MINLEFIENVEIFRGLNHDQLANIMICCVEQEFQDEARLFEKGEDAKFLWIVMKGAVDLRLDFPGLASSEENTITEISEGGAFGWSAIVSPNKYRLSGYSTAKGCKLIKVDRENLLKLFEKDPDIGYVVMSNLANLIGTRFHNLQDEAARRKGQDIMGGW